MPNEQWCNDPNGLIPGREYRLASYKKVNGQIEIIRRVSKGEPFRYAGEFSDNTAARKALQQNRRAFSQSLDSVLFTSSIDAKDAVYHVRLSFWTIYCYELIAQEKSSAPPLKPLLIKSAELDPEDSYRKRRDEIFRQMFK